MQTLSDYLAQHEILWALFPMGFVILVVLLFAWESERNR
jgi:ABC-type dipeptide/oligopeptide/nickel transport system permease subunit